MLKKLFLALIMVLPLSVFAQKFGTVDSQAVLTAMPEMKTANDQLTEASKKYEAEYQKLTEEVNKLVADFQSVQDDPNTPDTIKQRRMQEIQERGAKLEQFRATASEDLQRQNEQLMAPVINKFTEAVKAVGTEGGFTFILPNEQGLILFQGSDVIDVTPLVKAKLGI